MASTFNKIALLFILFSILTLAACGPGADSEQASKQSAASDLGQKVRYMSIGSNVRGLDPAGIGDVTSSSIGGQIYETLYQYHYLKRPYEVIPCLAAEMPHVSDDGKTVTIKLKRGVRFQDDPCFPNGEGREVVAQDMVYSWKRLADLTANLQTDNWWIFDGRIVGLNDFREYTGNLDQGEKADYSRQVDGLQAVDDHTLRLKLTKPFPLLKYLLSHLPTAVVPHEAVEKYGQEFINHPVGTGPFMLDTWDRGQRIALRANPDFRTETYPSEGEPGDKEAGLLEDAGKPLPLIDGVNIQIIKEDQPRWLLFMKGRLDASGIPKDNFSDAIQGGRNLTPRMQDKGIRLVTYETPATYWYGFNMNDPVLGNNKPLRQAMNAAFDRERYVKLFTNGRGEPAHGFLPPVMPAHSDDLNSPYTTYDLDRARELAEQAKKVYRQNQGGELPPVTLSLGAGTTTMRQRGKFISRAMQQANIPFEVTYSDWPNLQQKVKTGSAQMFGMGWVADYPDASNFLAIFFGPNKSPGPNSTNYDKAQFNDLYRKALTLPEDQRRQLYRQMEQMVVHDLPFLLSIHAKSYFLLYPWLENYKPMLYGIGTMKYSDIDVAMRRKRVGR